MSDPRQHIMPVYRPPEEVFDRGEGVCLFTEDGTRYLDFIAGIAVNALGHAHPAMVEALTDQAGKLWHTSNMFRVRGAEELADKICRDTFADRVFFTNSGTEAIECAIKSARKYQWANDHKERIDIITFTGAFHGRSLGAIMSFQSPLASKRIVVLLTAGDSKRLTEVANLYTETGKAQFVRGDLALFNGDQINNYLLGNQFYSGSLPLLMKLRWWFSRQPLFLVVLCLLAAFILAAVLFRVLRGMATARKQGVA